MTKKGGKLKKNWMCDWGTGRCPFLDKCWKQDPAKVEPGADKEVVEVYEW